MTLWITETDEYGTMPALELQVVPFGGKSKPLYVGTKKVRLHAKEDCLVAIGLGEPMEIAWWRLSAGISEWFVVTKDSPRPSIWVKAEEEE